MLCLFLRRGGLHVCLPQPLDNKSHPLWKGLVVKRGPSKEPKLHLDAPRLPPRALCSRESHRR